ncbi:hypothetical protein BpHYR1_041671 [Brachionus plicatilis]|uniref:SWIM-type domain-containing protein n=1 Tax=Brachionus plicatilis TaxID=10195 RepID=A0A3M7ST79_BRAPC|nr:hypothetical protein BpHYR1_041671 [Brachionus plicatilis]
MREYTIGWYEGYVIGFPTTNNALESTNNVIKNEGTLSEQLPMKDFVQFLEKFISELSKDCDPKFVTTKRSVAQPSISVRQWTNAFEWLRLDKRTIKLTLNQKVYYMCSSSEVTCHATKTICKGYFEESEWFLFASFIKEQNELRYVTFNNDQRQLSECSCPNWNKNYICKHAFGVAYNLGLCQFPSFDLNIECYSKRGRLKTANMALVTKKSTGSTNPVLQRINHEHQILMVDEQQHDNHMAPISQLSKQENNVINKLLIQPTSSITIKKINSKEAPKNRGRLTKINK